MARNDNSAYVAACGEAHAIVKGCVDSIMEGIKAGEVDEDTLHGGHALGVSHGDHRTVRPERGIRGSGWTGGVMSKRKIRELRPWNVKPGMLIMLGVRPASSWEGPASDWHEVIEVEKTRGKVTGARCWRITYKSHAYNPPFTGKPESVLRFRDQRVTVEG